MSVSGTDADAVLILISVMMCCAVLRCAVCTTHRGDRAQHSTTESRVTAWAALLWDDDAIDSNAHSHSHSYSCLHLTLP